MLRSQRLSRPFSRLVKSRYLPSGEMAVSVAVPELVAWVMENWAKGRGALRTKKLRRPKPVPTMRIKTIAAMAAAPNLCSLAAVAMTELPEECCATATDPDGDEAIGVAPVAPLGVALVAGAAVISWSDCRCLPELVSRFRRFKSARISAALW